MKHNFTWLTSERQLYRMKASVEREKAFRDKVEEVNKCTFEHFHQRRLVNHIVKDTDFQKNATKKARELQIGENIFKASLCWLHRFKKTIT